MMAKKEKPMFNDKMAILRNASREYHGLWFPKTLHTVTVTIEDFLKKNEQKVPILSILFIRIDR
jgi:hypothetical protein